MQYDDDDDKFEIVIMPNFELIEINLKDFFITI
jgi:hypothetical protein